MYIQWWVFYNICTFNGWYFTIYVHSMVGILQYMYNQWWVFYNICTFNGGYFTIYVHSMVGRESGLGGKNIKLKFMRVLETGGKGQEPVVSFQACFTASANTFYFC